MEAERSSYNNFELPTVNTQSLEFSMPNSPPLPYYEPEGSKDYKTTLEDAPPEYEAAVAMLPPEVLCKGH